MLKTMDHARYQKKVRGMSEAELDFVMRDAASAAEAGKGWNPNVGFYLDEVNYCADELARRRRKVTTQEIWE